MPTTGFKVGGSCFPDSLDLDEDENAVAYINITWTSNKLARQFGLTFDQPTNKTWATSDIIYMFQLSVNKTISGHLKSGANLGGNLCGSMTQSYQCLRESKFHIDDKVSVDFKRLQMQPVPLVKDVNGTHFYNPIICSANNDDNPSSSIVPIAVGCALAGLIVIVLVAYLIGRRRSGRGYSQM